ncbi:hypothetical protein LV779_26205 [Streptomyces thinghirensis]|nr:hypothetical protein [Streptomyces thinghirensis]
MALEHPRLRPARPAGAPPRSGVRSDGLEVRPTCLAAAFRVAGADGADPHGWLERYARGHSLGHPHPRPRRHRVLAADPRPRRAGPAHGRVGVGRARAAAHRAVANGRTSTPGSRTGWRSGCAGRCGKLPAPNNWYLFPYTVAGFLESVGRGDAETCRCPDAGRWS